MKPFYTLSGFADEIDSDFDRQLAVVGRLGIGAIELRGAYGKSVVSNTLDEAAELKKKLDAAGIRVSAIGSPIGKIGITDEFEPHFEVFRHTVELAKLFETPYIRIFSFYLQNQAPEAAREEVLARLLRLREYAKDQGVVLLHENEKGIYGDNTQRCLDLMENFGCENFKAVFDFANFVQCGQETQEAYEMLKPYIVYIHIKDAVAGTGKVVPAGQGDGRVKEILRQLFEDGYKGFLSLEPHLAMFNGFGALEKGTGEGKAEMTGEEAYTMAYMALKGILEELKIQFC